MLSLSQKEVVIAKLHGVKNHKEKVLLKLVICDTEVIHAYSQIQAFGDPNTYVMRIPLVNLNRENKVN